MDDPLHITVTGIASTQLLLRVVNLLAVRGLSPRRVDARVGDDAMVIRVELDDSACPHMASALADKLASFVEVADAVVRNGMPAD